MKASRFALLAITTIALPALAHAQPAASSTAVVNFHFDGTNSAGKTLPGSGGVVVGPYKANVVGSSTQFDLFCIDYDNAAKTNWSARVVSFADILANKDGALDAAKNQLGVSSISKNQLNLAGYLAGLFASANTSQWASIHGELWNIFSDNSDVSGYSLGTDLTNSSKGGLSALLNYDMIIDNKAYSGQCTNQWGYSTGACSQTFIVPGSAGGTIVTTPEPSTYALMGAGLLAVGFAARRRRRASVVA